MVNIPDSLKQAIEEEPERFIKGINWEKVNSSKDPKQEFLKQFEKHFTTNIGLNALKYLTGNYYLLNKLFKDEDVQERLNEEIQGETLKRKEVKSFWEERNKRMAREQEKIEKRLEKKPVEKKRKKWSDRQERFIKARLNIPLTQLAFELNKSFRDSQRTKFAIRDKRLRLLGKKK